MEHLFALYILKGRTYDSLTPIPGISAKTLSRYVHQRLETLPPELTLPLPDPNRPCYLVMDGLWFGKKFVLLLYRISGRPYIIHFSIAAKEWGYHIERDLNSILAKGYIISGVVTDGGKGMINAVKTVFPHKRHQICLAHVHREASKGVGKKPKAIHLVLLKKLVDHLFLIESKEALSWWIEEVDLWVKTHRDYLQEYTHDSMQRRWWYTHAKTRKTIKVLIQVPKQSFEFLRGHPLMPRTTNEIEGLNTNISAKWLNHRGLQKKYWRSFLQWFIYFRNLYYLSLEKKTKD